MTDQSTVGSTAPAGALVRRHPKFSEIEVGTVANFVRLGYDIPAKCQIPELQHRLIVLIHGKWIDEQDFDPNGEEEEAMQWAEHILLNNSIDRALQVAELLVSRNDQVTGTLSSLEQEVIWHNERLYEMIRDSLSIVSRLKGNLDMIPFDSLYSHRRRTLDQARMPAWMIPR